MTEVAGNGALLVDPESVAAIRKAVMRLENDLSLCKEIVRNGAENVRRLSPEAVARAYADLYKRVDKDA